MSFGLSLPVAIPGSPSPCCLSQGKGLLNRARDCHPPHPAPQSSCFFHVSSVRDELFQPARST